MNTKRLFASLIKNWPAKVFSLVLAVFFFVFFRISSLEERHISAPLHVEYADNMMPSSSYHRMIRVSIRGEANSIYSISEDDIEVYVDAGSFNSPGTYLVPIQWRKRGTALGVQPLQISIDPIEVSITLDYRITKTVPVLPNFQGNLGQGYIMATYSLNPSQVMVEGPGEVITGITQLYTEPINLDGRRSGFSENLRIMQRDPLVHIRGSGNTMFGSTIHRIVPSRSEDDLPIGIYGLREGFTAELDPPVGRIFLEAESREALDSFEIPPEFLWVNASGIMEEGNYILRMMTQSAGELSLRADPEEVRVRVFQEGELP